MRRCEATTKSDVRCLNSATEGSRFCTVHSNELDMKQVGWVAGGAMAGTAIMPGPGTVVGAFAGWVADTLVRDSVTTKRVFVSFDFDNDRTLKEFLIGQSKLSDSPFSVVDCSLKEAAPMKTWEDKARRAISGADLVIVIVGRDTYRASGVLKEVSMAREEGIPIIQMIGYRDGEYTPVADAGRLYAWNWDNLKKLLS